MADVEIRSYFPEAASYVVWRTDNDVSLLKNFVKFYR